MKPSHKNIILNNKNGMDNFPPSLRGNLEVYYDNPQHPTIIQDKSGYNRNGTVNGTVTDTTYLGRNVKTFNNNGRIVLPSGQNVNYLYPFKYEKEVAKVNLHQGVTYDGTYWYMCGSDIIKKFDADFNVLETLSGVGQAHTGGNHLGDLAYYDGKLYIPSETFTNCQNFSNQKIAVFNASDLSYITSHDISAQAQEVSALAINPEDGIIYIASYCTTNTLQMYDLTTFEYLGDLVTETISSKQGLDYYNGAIYVSGAIGVSGIIKLNKNSGVREGLKCIYPQNPSSHEGIYIADENTIYALIVDSSGITNLHRFKQLNLGWTIILWLNLPYLPSELTWNRAEILNNNNTVSNFNLYYNKTSNSSLYVSVTGVNGAGTTETKAQIKESDGLLVKNTPMMITASYDGQHVRLYLNNAQTGSVPSFDVGADLRVIYNLALGGQSTSPEWLLTGWVGELAILDKALSVDEIVEVYNRTRGKYGV